MLADGVSLAHLTAAVMYTDPVMTSLRKRSYKRAKTGAGSGRL
jgi:hypothetical protein